MDSLSNDSDNLLLSVNVVKIQVIEPTKSKFDHESIEADALLAFNQFPSLSP